MHGLACAGHHQGAGVRYFNVGVVLGGSLGNLAQDGDAGHRLDVVHVLNAGNEQNWTAHFRSATDGFINRVQPGDFANNNRVPRARPHNGTEDCHHNHNQ